MTDHVCPLCEGGTFLGYRGRENARCAGCGAKERERLMALVLRKVEIDPRGGPIYHFAPERALMGYFIERFGEAYNVADIEPELYSGCGRPVRRVDLSRPLEYFEPSSVGGFIHSHVLEHVPASIDRVVTQMNAALMPGGFHVFQVPIHSGWSREDMDPDMDPDARRERFFQEDHIRVFGTEDFAERVLSLFEDGFERVHIAGLVDDADALRAGIPVSAMSRLTGHSVFLFIKTE